ncbi:Aminopeptidase Y [Didymella sp. IMI 355093]|nr:Aminopeptidase Y [Didymella sp. IMI 355093]
MKFNNFELLASLLCAWLTGFVLGLWRSTPYITDHEASLVVALFAAVSIVAIYKRVSDNKTVAHLNRHVDDVHTMAILNLQDAHRKHVITVKSANNQNMREAQNEIRRITLNFDRLNSEYDYISTMYQDQTRLNSEQEDRIDYLEKKLKEFRQLSLAAPTAPFSAPASQIHFANPPRRVRTAVTASSPLSQEPMLQVPELEED